MRAVVWAVVSCGALALTTCVTAPPRPPPAPTTPLPPPRPALLVPDGCLTDLSGLWQTEHESPVHYEAVDDGGVVELVATFAPTDAGALAPRRFSRDGGLAWLVPDAGSPATSPAALQAPRVTLVLTRSETGFEGVAASTQAPQASCRPEFPARVVACTRERLELETLLSARFDAACRRLDGGAWKAQTLVRSPGSPDASWPAIDGG
ncbi:MAG: hypothetical protein MUC96_37440 [Myxococcaceae bacterium]|nr:hypothetical protein [Myxococcaceae bacterium]